MLANQRQNRENASRTSQGSRKYSAHASEWGSRYKEKAQQYYANFNGKHKGGRGSSIRNGEPMTPQQKKYSEMPIGSKQVPQNFYVRNAKNDENIIQKEDKGLGNIPLTSKTNKKEIMQESLNYLDRKGILTNKTNKRYYKDNDIAGHLKIDKKQWLCHQMRIPENQLRVRYPKNMTSLYQDDFERKRSCIGGKTAMFNRDKEKKFFKADPISMKTTKQIDFTGEQVPYERVKKNRPASSYGPFISSTSYGHTYQPWGAAGYVPTLAPKGNLQSSSNIPFRAVSSYRDTYRGGASGRPGTGIGATRSGNFAGDSGALGAGQGGVQGANGEIAAKDQMNVFGGKNRNQKSQISILSSPDKKVPFTKETTNRVEFRGQKSLERSRPIRHMDNLGNVDLKMDPNFFSTSYRTNFNDFGNNDPWVKEVERVIKRRELKQLQ